MTVELVIRDLGLVDYESTWQAMKRFTDERTANTVDELWVVQHPSVYTLGLAGKTHHILNSTTIPIVKSDRGGQVTYHGPGQVILYLLANIKRSNFSVKQIVCGLEEAIIKLLADYGVMGTRREGAPGVYIEGAKIGSLGLRIRRGCSYHGLSFNVDMDLTPFQHINPCGYANLPVTQLREYQPNVTTPTVIPKLIEHVARQFSYQITPTMASLRNDNAYAQNH